MLCSLTHTFHYSSHFISLLMTSSLLIFTTPTYSPHPSTHSIHPLILSLFLYLQPSSYSPHSPTRPTHPLFLILFLYLWPPPYSYSSLLLILLILPLILSTLSSFYFSTYDHPSLLIYFTPPSHSTYKHALLPLSHFWTTVTPEIQLNNIYMFIYL